MSINENEFYRRSLVDKLSEHKSAIALITLLCLGFTIFYLILAPKVYRTDATLEVLPKQDIISSAAKSADSEYERHFVTQMDFLESRYLIAKVLQNQQMNITYFYNGGLSPLRQLTDEPPFYVKHVQVKDPSFYDRLFYIKRVDQNRFALYMLPKQIMGNISTLIPKSKPLIYYFGKPVTTEYMDFTVFENRFSKKQDIYFNIEDDTEYIDKIQRNLTVMKNNVKSSLIKIIYDDTSPQKAQQFVNALLHEYMKVSAGQQATESKIQLDLLTEELDASKFSLDKSEKRLQTFTEDNRVAGISIQTSNLVNNINKYESELERLEIEAQNLRNMLSTYTKHYDYKDILVYISELGDANLIKLVDSIAKEEDQYIELRKKYKPLHPAISSIKKSIAQKSVTLESNLKSMLKNNISKRKKLDSYIYKYKKNLTSVPQKEIGYAKLKRDHDLLEKNYLSLLDKKRQLEIAHKMQNDYNYRVVDYAFLPDRHSKPKKSILLVLGTILGLLFGFLYALLREYFAKKITVPSEVEELTRLPYLGTIPYVQDKTLYNDIFVAKEPNGFAAQMMWSLRDRIDSFKTEHTSRVIAITSMVKGEGKTTLAANLAITLGMGDKKTIVLSLDLRLPEIHTKFGLPNEFGITSVLFGDKDLKSITYRSNQFPNLYVVPSGPSVDNPMQLINSNYIDKMIVELRQFYDYIIIDLPPAGVAAESVFLMKKADVVLSVLKSKYSEKSFVTYMENIATKNSIKHVGFVLNGVHKKYINIIARKENKRYINHNLQLTSSNSKVAKLKRRFF